MRDCDTRKGNIELSLQRRADPEKYRMWTARIFWINGNCKLGFRYVGHLSKFCSTAQGAGRAMSRTAARKITRRDVKRQ